MWIARGTNKVETYQIICDRCKKLYEDNAEHYCKWVDEDLAEAAAEEEGWIVADGEHYCPDCYEQDKETGECFIKL